MSTFQETPSTPIKPHALSKNAKLNEVVGVVKTAKEETHRALTAIYHSLQKGDHFKGYTKTYAPFNADDPAEQMPPEVKLVEQNALRLLEQVSEHLTREIDLESRREEANTQARADIMIGDEVLVAQVPATVLMPLEKQLRGLRAEIEKLPVLNPSTSWSWDKDQEVWKGAPEQKNKTKKVMVVVTKAPATDKHPAQAEIFPEDRTVGLYTQVDVSTAVTAAHKRALSNRCSALADAVKAALERANTTPAPPKPIAAKLLGFVFGSDA